MDPYHKSIIGEIRKFSHDEKTASFTWQILHYFDKYGTYASPTLKFFNMVWNLEVHIKNAYTDDEVYLFRTSSTSGIRKSLRFTMDYRKVGGRKETIVGRFPATANQWGPGVLRWQNFSDAIVIINCKLWKDESTHSETNSDEAETEDASCSSGRTDERVHPDIKGVSCETQTENASCSNDRNDEHHLKGHFKNLLISGDHHDVLIKVEDKEFRAHKCVLACSPVFAAMFRSEMKESVDHTVTIDDCDAGAFSKFLQYVYTGDVDIPSTGNALGLYYAGDKYDFPRLKEICVEYLKTSLTVTTIADVITLAARYDEQDLMQQGIVYFSKHLEEIMVTVEWQRFCVDNPIQANEMCLKAVQCLNERYKQTF